MNGPKLDGCLNYTGGISKEPQSIGNKRKTARRESTRRAVLTSSRGDWRQLFLNDSAGANLFRFAVSQTIEFTGDMFYATRELS
jgi:hypothetical protein